MVSIDWISDSTVSSSLVVVDSGYSLRTLLAVGEDSIITISPRYARLERWNLRTGSVTYSDSLTTEVPNVLSMVPLTSGMVSHGYLGFDSIYVLSTDAEGSRTMKLIRTVIDPEDLSIVDVGTQRTLGGANNIDEYPSSEFPPLKLSENTYAVMHDAENNLLIVDTYEQYVSKIGNWDPVGGYKAQAMGLFVDRTTRDLVLMVGRHHWVPGSPGHSYINLLDPSDLSQIVANNDYDPGTGAFLQRQFYRDTSDVVHTILYGATGGYPYTSYTSKWNALYPDNSDVAQEFVVTAGATYGTAKPGNRAPYVLGITSGGRLQLVVNMKARCGAGVTETGVSVLDVDDSLGDPQNLEEVKATVTVDDRAMVVAPGEVFMCASDWNVYVPQGVFMSGTTATSFVAQISDLPDLDPDPYGVIQIPSEGYTAASVTLMATSGS